MNSTKNDHLKSKSNHVIPFNVFTLYWFSKKFVWMIWLLISPSFWMVFLLAYSAATTLFPFLKQIKISLPQGFGTSFSLCWECLYSILLLAGCSSSCGTLLQYYFLVDALLAKRNHPLWISISTPVYYSQMIA